MPDRIGKARSQMTRYRRLGRGGECCARACNEFRAAQRQRIAATGSSQMCGGAETSKLPNSAGDRGFESISLQQRVMCELDWRNCARGEAPAGLKWPRRSSQL